MMPRAPIPPFRRRSRRAPLVRGLLHAGLVSLAIALIAGVASPAAAYPRPGRIERISAGADGVEFTLHPSISADGRYVAFHTKASNIVPGDTNGMTDVFVHDRLAGTTERVSMAFDGSQANGYSEHASLSADGRHVAFWSWSTKLVPGDTNGFQDIFVHDRQTGVTERVSVATDGTQGNQVSWDPVISADGRHVAFHSNASNLVPEDTSVRSDVFVHDRETGVTTRVSVGPGGVEGSGASMHPAISGDGRFVAFDSASPNLASGDDNGRPDVFVHDRSTGTTTRVSIGSDGTGANAYAMYPSISSDGRHVAFQSWANNLVPGDTNRVYDVFVHDRETGITERVSVAGNGAETVGPGDSVSLSEGHSYQPSISGDGRFVAFESRAGNLVAGDTNAATDIFVHDRESGTTDRVTNGYNGSNPTSNSYSAALSGDGRHLAFFSWAVNLVPGDDNGKPDVFAYDRGPSLGIGEIVSDGDAGELSVTGRATFSGRAISSGRDAGDDAGAGADQAGGELVGASLTYRHEVEDVLLRLELASLPGLAAGRCMSDGSGFTDCDGMLSTGAGIPGIVYGLRLETEGVRYEVRALRAAATGAQPSPAPLFMLYRCDAGCVESASLSGAIGTTGPEVRVSIPLSALAVSGGGALTGLSAFTSLGEAAPGAVETMDEMDLPATTIPEASVMLGVAPRGTPESEVAFDIAAELNSGTFSHAFEGSSLPPGDNDTWARACLGTSCGTSVRTSSSES